MDIFSSFKGEIFRLQTQEKGEIGNWRKSFFFLIDLKCPMNQAIFGEKG